MGTGCVGVCLLGGRSVFPTGQRLMVSSSPRDNICATVTADQCWWLQSPARRRSIVVSSSELWGMSSHWAGLLPYFRWKCQLSPETAQAFKLSRSWKCSDDFLYVFKPLPQVAASGRGPNDGNPPGRSFLAGWVASHVGRNGPHVGAVSTCIGAVSSHPATG